MCLHINPKFFDAIAYHSCDRAMMMHLPSVTSCNIVLVTNLK
ncbi:hypothetical protein [Nostoc sp.]